MQQKKIKFTDILVNPVPYEYNLLPFTPRKTAQMYFEQDESKITVVTTEKTRKLQKNDSEKDRTYHIPIDFINWEDKVLNEDQEHNNIIKNDLPLKLLLEDIFSGKWEKNIGLTPSPISLLYNDPNLIFTTVERRKKKQKKYNLSNDKYYTIKRQKKTDTLDILGIQHHPLALSLDYNFYQTAFSNQDVITWHRNYINNFADIFRHENQIQFTNLNNSLEFNSEIVDPLSLKNGIGFVLIEYCEEYPIYVCNGGMVSIICNYKRSTRAREEVRERETFAPIKYHLNTILLKEEEASPLPLIDIKGSKNQTIFYNNIVKTQLYDQPSKNLFLVILNEGTKIYNVMPINNLFVSSQTLPVEEIFSPHSKTLNVYCKNRLKMAALKLLESRKERDSNCIIKMKDLDELFPTFSEGLKRKWLKEYAEKRKDNSYVLNIRGYIKDDDVITPENVCQYESMLVGERRIKDGVIDNEMSPWNLSRNFIKGTIGVLGTKDPLNGSGLSFMKGILDKESIQKRWENMENILCTEMKLVDLKENEYKDYRNTYKRKEQVKSKQTTAVSSDVEEGIKIKRYIKGVYEEEVITDPEIIMQYLKERKQIKKYDKKITIKCSKCGELGHMKTNKTCSFYENSKSNRKRSERKGKKRYTLTDIILQSIYKLFHIPHGSVFHRPVNTKRFTNYLNYIKEPIDLGTIKTKAKANLYKEFKEYINDIKLLHSNCAIYNGESHSFSRIAFLMVNIVEKQYNERKEYIESLEIAPNNNEDNTIVDI